MSTKFFNNDDGNTLFARLASIAGESGMGDSTANLQALAPGARVLEGRRFRASASAEDLKAWAESF